ncbi:MAG: SDR family NAD(P)-dependent oxidoreductase [Spirochaetales bacterium]|nr:SDR family NAD(P)-dependent oxidoreductase [Spirochaetales bacterium]
MENKVAVVTGASSGIGKAIAQSLQSEGYQLVLNGRTCQEHYDTSPNLVINNKDLLDEKTPGQLLAHCLDNFGKCDYLFVNAGTLATGTIEEIDIDKVCQMARLKVESSYRLIYTFLKEFKKQGTGHIFITSSILGTKVRETAGAYAGCNYALEALAEALRMELSPTDIQITCLEPGLVSTGLHRDWEIQPAELLNITNTLTPEDIADAVKEIISKPSHIRIPRYMILPKGHRI